MGGGEVGEPEALEQVRAVPPPGEPYVAGDREVREQPVILRQVADPASFGAQGDAPPGVEPDLGTQGDASGVGALEAGDGPQQRGLSRTGPPDENDRLGADVQRRAKLERAPGQSDVNFQKVGHELTSSLEVSRMAPLTMISSTPIAIAWSRLASNSE